MEHFSEMPFLTTSDKNKSRFHEKCLDRRILSKWKFDLKSKKKVKINKMGEKIACWCELINTSFKAARPCFCLTKNSQFPVIQSCFHLPPNPTSRVVRYSNKDKHTASVFQSCFHLPRPTKGLDRYSNKIKLNNAKTDILSFWCFRDDDVNTGKMLF